MFVDSGNIPRGYDDILMFSIYQPERKFNNIREKERNVSYILLKAEPKRYKFP